MIDITDPEYTIPGELDRPPVEAWPERTDRRIASLEARVRHLERVVHQLINQPHPINDYVDPAAAGWTSGADGATSHYRT